MSSLPYIKTEPYDVAEHLRTEEERMFYLGAILIDGEFVVSELHYAIAAVERSRRLYAKQDSKAT